MPSLLPVNWQIERLRPSGYYAYAWGGGLAEPERTDGFATAAQALAALRRQLKKVGRCPDPSLCNERTEGGRALLAVLSSSGQ
jgi:hypothetical protein